MGTLEESAAFLESLWPDACGIADPEMRLYDTFDVGHGGMAEMFGPGAVACGFRATLKGNFIGRKHGDPWTLPVFAFIWDGIVKWRHDGAHAGDHPRWDTIAELVSA